MHEYGMMKSKSEEFSKNFGVSVVNSEKGVFFRPLALKSNAFIIDLRQDCTSCTIANLSNCAEYEDIKLMLTEISRWMSYNGLITGFFTISIGRGQEEDTATQKASIVIDKLKSLEFVTGLNVRLGNRHGDEVYYQISGILHCPNPVVRTYGPYKGNFDENHDHWDMSNFKTLNNSFGL